MNDAQIYEVIVTFTENGIPRKRRFGSTESMESVQTKAAKWMAEQGFTGKFTKPKITSTYEVWKLGEVNQ